MRSQYHPFPDRDNWVFPRTEGSAPREGALTKMICVMVCQGFGQEEHQEPLVIRFPTEQQEAVQGQKKVERRW